MKIRLYLTALLFALPIVGQAQDTTAIKAALAKQKPFIRDTIDKDKTRPQYTRRAQDSALVYQNAVLAAMRKKMDSTPPAPSGPASVAIHSNGDTVPVGKQIQLLSEVKDANNVVIPAPVSWTVNNTAIATISGTGLLLGVKPGTVTVSARATTALVTTRDYAVKDTTKPAPPDTVTPPAVTFDGPAELPKAKVDVNIPTGYTVVNVPAQAGALQAAIDAASCRTELRGAPGFSYSPIVLRAKPCNERYHTIIRTANGLPDVARLTRITPAMSVQRNQTKIVSTGGNSPAVLASTGVRGYYFEDVNIRVTAGPLSALVYLGNQQTTLADVPGDFVFSHVYAGGTPTVDLKRCWYLNSFSTAIIDSWSDECHSNAGDSQWILGLNGPGPYYIVNNYGEAGHEVVMFGGGDPSIPNLIPSDITIIGNHITRPSSWKGVWQVKNLIECKNVRRLLVEGNVIENVWADGQVGYAFLCKSVNQDGTAPWSQSRDVTVRYNLFRNAGAGFNFCSVCQAPAVPSVNYSVHDNIMIGVNKGIYGGEAREWQFLGALSKLSIVHNTTIDAVGVQTAISFDQQPPKITNFDFRSIAYDRGLYDIHGGSGGSDWRNWVDSSSSNLTHNLNYPVGAWQAAGFDAKGYYTGTMMGHDGKPVGADAAKVYEMTAKSVVTDPLRGARRRAVATPRQSGYKPTTPEQREANTKNGPSVR